MHKENVWCLLIHYSITEMYNKNLSEAYVNTSGYYILVDFSHLHSRKKFSFQAKKLFFLMESWAMKKKNRICEKEKAENKWGSEHSNAKILSNYLFNWVMSLEKDKLSGVHIWWESLCHGSQSYGSICSLIPSLFSQDLNIKLCWNHGISGLDKATLSSLQFL